MGRKSKDKERLYYEELFREKNLFISNESYTNPITGRQNTASLQNMRRTVRAMVDRGIWSSDTIYRPLESIQEQKEQKEEKKELKEDTDDDDDDDDLSPSDVTPEQKKYLGSLRDDNEPLKKVKGQVKRLRKMLEAKDDYSDIFDIESQKLGVRESLRTQTRNDDYFGLNFPETRDMDKYNSNKDGLWNSLEFSEDQDKSNKHYQTESELLRKFSKMSLKENKEGIPDESKKQINQDTKEDNELFRNSTLTEDDSKEQMRRANMNSFIDLLVPEDEQEEIKDFLSKDTKQNETVIKDIENILKEYAPEHLDIKEFLGETEKLDEKHTDLVLPSKIERKMSNLLEASGVSESKRFDSVLEQDIKQQMEQGRLYDPVQDPEGIVRELKRENALPRIIRNIPRSIPEYKRVNIPTGAGVGQAVGGAVGAYLGGQSGANVGQFVGNIGGRIVDRAVDDLIGKAGSKISEKIWPRKPQDSERETEDEPDEEKRIIDEINKINERLQSKTGRYFEERDLIHYRFPKPNENYNAVQLTRNSITAYLNDQNLYGEVDTGGFDEI